MTQGRPALLMTAATFLSLGLGGCGDKGAESGASNAMAPSTGELLDIAPRGEAGSPSPGMSGTERTVPALTLASGPDVCFRAIAKQFGPDVKISEVTSFFSAGEAISGRESPPRGEMTSCSLTFQNPSDPRKLLAASFNTRTGTFGEPNPVEITVMGDAASFRLDDHVIPLSRVNAAALAGVMSSQDKRLKSVYGDYAWSGVRLSGPDAFSRTHTLRLDVDGRLAANDIKESGYASVSLDGKRITSNHLMP